MQIVTFILFDVNKVVIMGVTFFTVLILFLYQLDHKKINNENLIS